MQTQDQTGITYGGALEPFTDYTVTVTATGVSGDQAVGTATFRTGRLDTPWQGQWITDNGLEFSDKVSPTPLTFASNVELHGQVRRAWVVATALGIYQLTIDGRRVGEDYFAPGFTSYAHQIQYQTYDVTDMLQPGSRIEAVVGAGWAVGVFTTTLRSKIYADRQAFLCEVHIEYQDGTSSVQATGPHWQVTQDGPYRAADWYGGETYDARPSCCRGGGTPPM